MPALPRAEKHSSLEGHAAFERGPGSRLFSGGVHHRGRPAGDTIATKTLDDEDIVAIRPSFIDLTADCQVAVGTFPWTAAGLYP